MNKIIFILLFVSKAGLAQTNLNNGLKAHYPFNGSANDISGNNNNPVFNNASLTNDRFGNTNKAYHFNGINNYMRIANSNSLNLQNTITLTAWVRPTGFYYDVCHSSAIISKGTADYFPGNYTLRFDDALFTEGKGCSGDKLKDSTHFNFRGTGTIQKSYLPFIKKNQWYSVVYTNDGNKASLYVDCELKYTVNFKETFTNKDDLFFGTTNDNLFPFWLNADVDDVRIYDRAITQPEIIAICKEQEQKDTIITAARPKEIQLEKRTNELIRQIEVEHDSIAVTLYDNGEVDGDSVTLIYNNKIITTHQRLTDKGITFKLKVNAANAQNELVMYAENLGSIPPNTALMVIYDGIKRYEVNITSNNRNNGSVAFKLKQ